MYVHSIVLVIGRTVFGFFLTITCCVLWVTFCTYFLSSFTFVFNRILSTLILKGHDQFEGKECQTIVSSVGEMEERM